MNLLVFYYEPLYNGDLLEYSQELVDFHVKKSKKFAIVTNFDYNSFIISIQGTNKDYISKNLLKPYSKNQVYENIFLISDLFEIQKDTALLRELLNLKYDKMYILLRTRTDFPYAQEIINFLIDIDSLNNERIEFITYSNSSFKVFYEIFKNYFSDKIYKLRKFYPYLSFYDKKTSKLNFQGITDNYLDKITKILVEGEYSLTSGLTDYIVAYYSLFYGKEYLGKLNPGDYLSIIKLNSDIVKGYNTLIQLVNGLKSAISRYYRMKIGDGLFRIDFPPILILTNLLTLQEKNHLYNVADIVVYPNKTNFFPLPILYAIKFQKKLLTTYQNLEAFLDDEDKEELLLSMDLDFMTFPTEEDYGINFYENDVCYLNINEFNIKILTNMIKNLIYVDKSNLDSDIEKLYKLIEKNIEKYSKL